MNHALSPCIKQKQGIKLKTELGKKDSDSYKLRPMLCNMHGPIEIKKFTKILYRNSHKQNSCNFTITDWPKAQGLTLLYLFMNCDNL